MIAEPTVSATCHLLVERYHRAFEEELPRLENLGWKVAHAVDVPALFARSLMHALLRLKDEIFRHAAVAEATVHPFAGTPDGDVLLEDHIRDHVAIRELVADARRIAAECPPPSRIGAALKDGLVTLERNLERYFTAERTLKTYARTAERSSTTSSPSAA